MDFELLMDSQSGKGKIDNYDIKVCFLCTEPWVALEYSLEVDDATVHIRNYRLIQELDLEHFLNTQEQWSFVKEKYVGEYSNIDDLPNSLKGNILSMHSEVQGIELKLKATGYSSTRKHPADFELFILADVSGRGTINGCKIIVVFSSEKPGVILDHVLEVGMVSVQILCSERFNIENFSRDKYIGEYKKLEDVPDFLRNSILGVYSKICRLENKLT